MRSIDKAFMKTQRETFDYYLYHEAHYDMCEPIKIAPLYEQKGPVINSYLKHMISTRDKSKRFDLPLSGDVRISKVDMVSELFKDSHKSKTPYEFTYPVVKAGQSVFLDIVNKMQEMIRSKGFVVHVPDGVRSEHKVIGDSQKYMEAYIEIDIPFHLDLFQATEAKNQKASLMNNRIHVVPYIMFICTKEGRIISIVQVSDLKKNDQEQARLPFSIDFVYDDDILDISCVHYRAREDNHTVILPCYDFGKEHGYITFDLPDDSDQNFQALRIKDKHTSEYISEPIVFTHQLGDPLSVTCNTEVVQDIVKKYAEKCEEMKTKLINDIDPLVDVDITYSLVDKKEEHKGGLSVGSHYSFCMIMFNITCKIRFIPVYDASTRYFADIQYIRKVFEILQWIIRMIQEVVQRIVDEIKKEQETAKGKKDALKQGKYGRIPDDLKIREPGINSPHMPPLIQDPPPQHGGSGDPPFPPFTITCDSNTGVDDDN